MEKNETWKQTVKQTEYVCRKCKWSKKSDKPITKCGDCGGKYVVAV